MCGEKMRENKILKEKGAGGRRQVVLTDEEGYKEEKQVRR